VTATSRTQRLALKCDDGFRDVFWTKFLLDHSLLAGFAHPKIFARETLIDSKRLPLGNVPLAHRRGTKASLHTKTKRHPMPRVHIHSNRNPYLIRENTFDWFPVVKVFNFLHGFTGPLTDWPVSRQPLKGRLIVPFPGSPEQGARITVTVIPREGGPLLTDAPFLGGYITVAPEFRFHVAVVADTTEKVPNLAIPESLLRSRQPQDLSHRLSPPK
jgi:hypothetical protein